MQRLEVSKNSEFFTAICKTEGGEPHSFLVFGIRDKVKKESLILFGVGKYFKYRESSYFNFMFNQVNGMLRNEFRAGSSWYNKVTYQAHSVTQQQYLSFIQYMTYIAFLNKSKDFFWHLDENNERVDPFREGFCGYQLTGETEDKFIFEYKNLSAGKTSFKFNQDDHLKIDAFRQSIDTISRGNSCRSTAKIFFDAAVDGRAALDTVGDGYTDDLPHPAFIQGKGYIATPYFFIFPLPPSPVLGDENNVTYKIRSRIYRQMQTLTKSHQQKKLTFDKFEALKALYQSLDTRSVADISDVFTIIGNWEADNKVLIAEHRGFHFFDTSLTATQEMLAELYQMQRDVKPVKQKL